MDAFAALVLAESGLWQDRVRAAGVLSAHIGSPPVDAAMRVLLLDTGDTAVTVAAARALLERGDAPALRLFAEAWQHAAAETADHLAGEWSGALFAWSCATPHIRRAIQAVLTELTADADAAVSTQAQRLLDQFMAATSDADSNDHAAVATPDQVQELLDELCVTLGFCLPSEAQLRLRLRPSREVHAFADAVFTAEGMDPFLHQRLHQQVCEHVERHLARWAI